MGLWKKTDKETKSKTELKVGRISVDESKSLLTYPTDVDLTPEEVKFVLSKLTGLHAPDIWNAFFVSFEIKPYELMGILQGRYEIVRKPTEVVEENDED